jgi:hypothetical protein
MKLESRVAYLNVVMTKAIRLPCVDDGICYRLSFSVQDPPFDVHVVAFAFRSNRSAMVHYDGIQPSIRTMV